ncbi:MAG: DNA polymerase III subunit beta [Candidatus Dojkabacteria bacterium]|nr:DNA polymerase III subunit beta [Candidatus Dojkabacteria bacterium]
MKVSCNQSSLARQLAVVGRLVSSKPGLPILANVFLKAEDSKLKMTATDLELGVHTWIGAEIKAEGTITIPARTFAEFVNSLPSETVEVELDKQTLSVTTVNNSAQFNTLPADDFPAVPGVDEQPVLMSVPSEALQTAINRVAFAAATDDSRPVLTGIKIEAEGTGLTLVAVDGFRLSRQNIELDKSVQERVELLVPARAMQELARVISDMSGDGGKKKSDRVEVYLLEGKNQVAFRYREVDLISRLIDGQFPEYKQIIPTGYQTKSEMDTDQFQNAVRIVNIFARSTIGNKAIIEFNPKDKKINVSASLAEVGGNESSIEAAVEGEPLKIGFSGKFLTDMLSSMHGDTILFEGSNSTAPGVFKTKGDDSFLHIIMPMRIE